jgi:hypothetical protein
MFQFLTCERLRFANQNEGRQKSYQKTNIKKMKRNLFVFTFVLLSSFSFCQELKTDNSQTVNYPAHATGDFSIAGSPNILFNTPNGTQFAGGLMFRLFLGKRISFDTDIAFGRDYLHAGPGIIGLPVWFLFCRPQGLSTNYDAPFSDFLFYIVAMVLSAEHIAYHIPVNSELDISPYMSLLRYKSSYKYGDYYNPKYAGEQFSFALGLEINKYFKRFQLSPYVEYNIGYTDHISGFNTGVYCGYYFRRK